MKKIFKNIVIVALVLFTFSCEKSLLEGDDTKLGPKVLPMQIAEHEALIASEIGHMLVFANTTDEPFTKFRAEHLSDFEGYMSDVIIEIPYDITVDANGNFSRPIQTVLLKYPVKATTKSGDILKVKFTFTDQKGREVSGISSKKVVNFRTNSVVATLTPTSPWYNFSTGKIASKASIGNATIKDDLHVFWMMKDGVQYLCSPNSDRTAAEFKNLTYYIRESTHHTKFIKLSGVTFAEVDDETFKNMDFSNASDEIVMEHLAMYGLLFDDGRRAVLSTQIYGTVYARVTSKYELSAQ